jgi:undecaprenyl-diphosphatase
VDPVGVAGGGVLEQVRDLQARPLERFAVRISAGLVAVAVAGLAFAVLLALVHGAWTPLEEFDRAVADALNSRVAGSKIAVKILKSATDFGGRTALMLVLLAGTGYLLIRRQPRLAVYVAVTAGGAFVLDPVVKLLVERVRPVVEAPVAAAPGPSFPSGHALASLVSYGVLLLVFLPTLSRRWRVAGLAVVVTLVVVVGFTRMALGVHYLTDVVAGWALGVVWLTVTAVAFRTWRRETGRNVPPLADGLDPEAGAQITAAPAEHGEALPHPWIKLTELAVAWVLVVGIVFGAGFLVTVVLDGSPALAFDRDIVQWLAGHRTARLTSVSSLGSHLGSTGWIVLGTLAAGGLALAICRRWRPVIFLAVVMVGGITLFLATSTVVGRARPAVQPLNPDLPPAASFPSGHVAGLLCLCLAIAVLLRPARSRTLRWSAAAAAVVLPGVVAVSRLYRAAHHPTDILGSVLLAAVWVAAVWWIIRPHPVDPHPDPNNRADLRI